MIRILLILLICQLKKVGWSMVCEGREKKNWQNSECARIFKTPNQNWILSLYYLRWPMPAWALVHIQSSFFFVFIHICNKKKIYWKSINQNLYSFYFPLIKFKFYWLKRKSNERRKVLVETVKTVFKNKTKQNVYRTIRTHKHACTCTCTQNTTNAHNMPKSTE